MGLRHDQHSSSCSPYVLPLCTWGSQLFAAYVTCCCTPGLYVAASLVMWCDLLSVMQAMLGIAALFWNAWISSSGSSLAPLS